MFWPEQHYNKKVFKSANNYNVDSRVYDEVIKCYPVSCTGSS